MPIPEAEIVELVRKAVVTTATEVEGGTVVEAESEGFSAPAESPAEGGIEGEGLEMETPEGGETEVPSAAIEIFVPGVAPDEYPEGEPLVGEAAPAAGPVAEPGAAAPGGVPPGGAPGGDKFSALLNAPRPRGGV